MIIVNRGTDDEIELSVVNNNNNVTHDDATEELSKSVINSVKRQSNIVKESMKIKETNQGLGRCFEVGQGKKALKMSHSFRIFVMTVRIILF